MHSEEHYLSKIERNTNVIDKAPEHIKKKCVDDVIWARNLSNRLHDLDYDQRNDAIAKMHEILDEDYIAMGFELKETKNKNR